MANWLAAFNHHKPFQYMLRVALFLLLCLPNIAIAGTLSWLAEERWVTVDKVYDGDTFQTRHGEKIRLLGINTPEIQHRDSIGQMGGNEAKQALKQLISGKQLRLRFDKEKKDRYGRTLAQIWMADGLWVNAWLLEHGFAHVYTFEPNTRWTKELLHHERIARQQAIGIWQTSRFEMLEAEHVSSKHIGQFRVIHGSVKKISDKYGWQFQVGKIMVSIPKKARKAFKYPPHLKAGQELTVRGKIRISSKDNLFLTLYSPADLEL